MPATHTFANLCARQNRSPLYVRGLQRRYGLPIPAGSTGSPTWFLDASGSTANPAHRLLLRANAQPKP
jgi:hypothetical protein